MNGWVLLLRGVNVGGRNRLAMDDLRATLATLGVRNVASYIQSGNAVFTGVIDGRAFGGLVEEELQRHHGLRPRALVLSAESFEEIARAYPWPDDWHDPTRGHVWFLDRPAAPDPEALRAAAAPGERWALAPGAFYLHAPAGIGQSRLAERAERLLGVAATARNLATVQALRGLLAALPDH